VTHRPVDDPQRERLLSGYVYVDVADATSAASSSGQGRRARSGDAPRLLPEWSGQYENMIRVRERLKWWCRSTIFLIFLLLYMNTKSACEGRPS
jgi:Cu(I)/Ag(I) efflux system membrane protein CusA/SilA